MPADFHVLIVDDTLADANAAIAALRDADFAPKCKVVSTRDALWAALDSPVDVILAERGFAGLGLGDVLREVSLAGLNVPTIVVSRENNECVIVASIREGAADYVTKDNLGRLGQAVRDALARRTLRGQADGDRTARVLMNCANDALIMIDAETERIVDCSASAAELLGRPIREIVGLHQEQLPPAEDAARHAKAFDAMLRAGRRGSKTVRFQRPDGSRPWVEIGSDHRIVNGRRMLVCICRDVTPRKKAEGELIRLNRALRTISECDDAIVQARDESELLEQVCGLLVKTGGYHSAWVSRVCHNGERGLSVIAHASAEGTEPSPQADAQAAAETAIRTGKPCVVRLLDVDRGVVGASLSAIALPLRQRGVLSGALAVCSAEADAFEGEEKALLDKLVSDLGHGIEMLRVRAERDQAMETLKYRLTFESYLISASAQFLNSAGEDEEQLVLRFLRRLGELTGVDNCFIEVLQGEGRIRERYEWRRDGHESRMLYMSRLFLDERYEWMHRLVARSEVLHIESLDDFPVEAHAEARLCRALGVRSILAFPLTYGNAVVAGMGFCTQRAEHAWSEQDIHMLKVAGNILIGALERTRVENSLRDSEERLRIILEATSDGVWDQNMVTGATYYSPAWAETLGYNPCDIAPTGGAWESLIHPDDRATVAKEQKAHIEQESEDFKCEYRLRNKHGHWQWVLSRGKIIKRDSRGRPLRIVGTHTDIDDRKRVEDALRDSEEQFRRLAETTPAAIAIHDGEFLVYMNPAAQELLGCSSEELAGTPYWSLAHEDFREELRARGMRLLDDRGPGTRSEVLIRTKNGNARWLDLGECPISLGDSRGVLLTALDITERKLAEQTLRENEENLRRLLWNMPVMMDAYDEDMTFLAWNAECERVTGYSAEEIIGNPNVLEMLYPDDEYRNRMLALYREGSGGFRDWEWEIRCKDGAMKTISWFDVSSKFPIPGWAGWAIGVDVTERNRLEHEILEVSSRERREIGQNLHDGLGQHLTGIAFLAKVLTQKLRNEDRSEADDAELIASLVRDAISDTRALAKGLHIVGLEEGGLMMALQELAQTTRQVFGVPCSLACAKPVLMDDETCANHLFRIAQEAVTNAIKHSNARSIDVRLSHGKRDLVLEVTDDGDGFDTKASRGGGMGLNIMRYRAKMMGATLTVRSAPGHGATVICTLQDHPAG